jgi:hypothetical protein
MEFSIIVVSKIYKFIMLLVNKILRFPIDDALFWSLMMLKVASKVLSKAMKILQFLYFNFVQFKFN